MRTKETQEYQTDDINKLCAEVGRRIAEVRRTSGLSHHELAGKLGVAVWYSEILENGILVSEDNKHYLRWNKCLFRREELMRISGQLSICLEINSRVRETDSETVFFCSVTINRSAVVKELQSLAENLNILPSLERQAVGMFSLKCRLLFLQVYLKNGRRNAELMRQKLLSVLDSCKTHS